MLDDFDPQPSRTEQKKARERLSALALPLANLSPKARKKLPASEFFLDELAHLASIDSMAAKNRQIKRVGKLIEEESVDKLTEALFLALFDANQAQKIDSWSARLLTNHQSIKLFCQAFGAAEKHTLTQMVLGVGYAKMMNEDDEAPRRALCTYIRQVAILSKGN